MILGQALFALAAIPAQGQTAIPPTLHLDSTDQTVQPVWVSADVALDEDGIPRREFATLSGDELVALDERGAPIPLALAPPGTLPTVRNSFRRQLTASESEALRLRSSSLEALACPSNDIVFGHDWDTVIPATTISDRAAVAEEVYLLEIESTESGFLPRMPHTLLETRVQRVFRSDANVSVGERLLVAYRFARFVRGNTLWCNIDPAFNLRPQPGDRLLLIRRGAPHTLTTAGSRLVVPDEYEAVLGRPDDTVVWSRSLRRLDPRTTVEVESFPELLALIEGAAGKSRAEGSRAKPGSEVRTANFAWSLARRRSLQMPIRRLSGSGWRR